MFEAMTSGKGFYETFNKGSRIYDGWLKNTNNIALKGFDLSKKAALGDMDNGHEADAFYKACETAAREMIDLISENLEETPFEPLKPVNQMARTQMEIMTGDRNFGPKLMKDMFDCNVKMVSFVSSAMKTVRKGMADMCTTGIEPFMNFSPFFAFMSGGRKVEAKRKADAKKDQAEEK